MFCLHRSSPSCCAAQSYSSTLTSSLPVTALVSGLLLAFAGVWIAGLAQRVCGMRGPARTCRPCAATIIFALGIGGTSSSPPLADLPPVALKLAGSLVEVGTERALNLQSSSLVLQLTGDTWAANISSDTEFGASRAALLSSFESLQPHEPAGWRAVVAPALNASLTILRNSDREIQLQLPRLRCYDLLYPEIVMVRLSGATTASGRAVTAPPLRIRADATVRPPLWGSVRTPPREVWRNCTHVTLSWAPPADDGGTALAGYRVELLELPASFPLVPPSPPSSELTEPLSLGPALDDNWNSSTELIAAQPGLSEVQSTIGPLRVGAAYRVRVRAFATGTGCVPVPGDDGAALTIFGGWRADRLEVDVGPEGGGPIDGGTIVRVHGACMDGAGACVWEEPPSQQPAAGGSNISDAPLVTTADALSGAELKCPFPKARRVGMHHLRLQLISAPVATAARATNLNFEAYSMRAIGLAPVAGPVQGGTALRLSVDMAASLELQRHVSLRDARCRFHGAAVNATTLPVHASAFELICPTPPAGAVGPANVTVSIDAGRSFTAPLPEASAFLYYNASLGHVHPLGGPIRGGTITTVMGSGLAGGAGDNGESWCLSRVSCAQKLHCRFGTLGGRVAVAATNESSITCVAPPTTGLASGGPPRLTAAVDLVQPSRLVGSYPWDALFSASDALSYSLNGEAYLSPRLEWTYYVPPTVSSLQPADGPASGGHSVTVRGEGFMRLPLAGATAARCRFGGQVTRVVEIRNDSFLICDAPSDHAARDAALAAPTPSEKSDRAARGIGDDARFDLIHVSHHCCAVGASAARVGGSSGHGSRSECEASCIAAASCRYMSYADALGSCDLCVECTDAATYSSTPFAANASWASAFDSYSRVEPILPALMPFSLSLNGQQYELNDADWTAELGYVMYAATVYNLSIGGGPTTGGTLVTLTGRGFARAGARPSSAPQRFGNLWWHRNASIAPRCLFGAFGSTSPIQLRDDELICPTPSVPDHAMHAASGTLDVGLTLGLNAVHFQGERPVAAVSLNSTYDLAHFEGKLAPESPNLGLPINFTFYEQHVSAIFPPGGPTLGGTVVRVEGIGLRRFAPHAAACTFGVVPSDVSFGATDEASSSITPVNCTSPPLPPRNATSFRLALNYQRRECEPTPGVLPPAFSIAQSSRGTSLDKAECYDGYRLETVSGNGFRGSFRPREGLAYDYYNAPIVSAIFPVRGARSGGTPVTVTGVGLRGVATAPLLCGFGLEGSTPFPPAHTTSNASLVYDIYEPLAARLAMLSESLPDLSIRLAAHSLSNVERRAAMDAAAVVCHSPWRPAGSRSAERLTVAPNGQDFEGGGPLSSFQYLDPLVPNTSFPLGGPVAGEPYVRVLGAGFVNVSDGTLRCKFGDAEVPAAYLPMRRAEVEGVLVRGVHAVAVAEGQTAVLGCRAPRAHDAGATLLIRRNFNAIDTNASRARAREAAIIAAPGRVEGGGRGDPEEGGVDELRGDAVVEGRSLRLTVGMILTRPSIGTFIVARNSLAPASIVISFEASFELQMGDNGGGRGLSFSYGLPPNGANALVDETGLEVGLTVSLLTETPPTPDTVHGGQPEHRMEVRFNGKVVERAYLGRSLRSTSWANMTVKYDSTGLEVH